jgi:hypothetical protein
VPFQQGVTDWWERLSSRDKIGTLSFRIAAESRSHKPKKTIDSRLQSFFLIRLAAL